MIFGVNNTKTGEKRTRHSTREQPKTQNTFPAFSLEFFSAARPAEDRFRCFRRRRRRCCGCVAWHVVSFECDKLRVVSSQPPSQF